MVGVMSCFMSGMNVCAEVVVIMTKVSCTVFLRLLFTTSARQRLLITLHALNQCTAYVLKIFA